MAMLMPPTLLSLAIRESIGYGRVDEADRRADEWAKHQDSKQDAAKQQDEATKV